MDNQINQLHELLQTMIDGANYVSHQITHGDLSMAVIVTEDIITGFMAVESTIHEMDQALNNDDVIFKQITKIKASLDKMVLSFESEAYQQVASIINRSLVKQLTEMRLMIEPFITT